MSKQIPWRTLAGGLVVLVVIGLCINNLSGMGSDPSEPLPLVENLNGPRGVSVGPFGLVAYTENDGSFSALVTKGPLPGRCCHSAACRRTSSLPRSRWAASARRSF